MSYPIPAIASLDARLARKQAHTPPRPIPLPQDLPRCPPDCLPVDVTTATSVIDRNFAAFDTAAGGDPAQADGRIDYGDLQAVANNAGGRFSCSEVAAAQLLLDSQAASSFLDVGAGIGWVDGIISREDVDGALGTIDGGGLDLALLDTAAGIGGRDGYISKADLDAVRGDPGIPPQLRTALQAVPGHLPPATQVAAVQSLIANTASPDSTEVLADLYRSDAFAGLSEAEQQKVIALFGGTSGVSAKAREDLISDVPLSGPSSDPGRQMNIDLKDPESLREYMQYFARPVDKWRDVQPTSGVPDDQRSAYTVSDPVDITHDFASATVANQTDSLPAMEYTVTINGREIKVIIPKDLDTEAHAYPTAEQIAKGLAAMPEASLEATSTVVVNPARPFENGAAMYANRDEQTFWINPGAANQPWSQRSLDYTFLHESAHLVEQPSAYSLLPWAPPGWNQAIESDGVFPTHYASANYIETDQNHHQPSLSPTEDFAEAYLIYHAVVGTPDEAQMRALMPERFKILDQMFGH